jgi:hypothetical protein
MKICQQIEVNENICLCLFYIANMYTNNLHTELPEIIHYVIKNSRIHYRFITETQNLLHIILEQNYYQYNNCFYKQTEGLDMGAPMSSLLSEICLQYLELNKIEYYKDIT